jgi:putative heme iron utilization protein
MKGESSDDISIEEARQWLQDFPRRVESLILATVNPQDGTPNSSYTPFIHGDENEFYIFVSSLARHTKNLESGNDVSVMLLEDESLSSSVFARKRLTYECMVTEVEKNSADWNDAADSFQERFGDIFNLLRSLPDFRMFRLDVKEGLLVLGFGKAYPVKDGQLLPAPEMNSGNG